MKTIVIIQFALVIIFFVVNSEAGLGFLQSSVQKLRAKAKEYYQKYFLKNKKWQFLGLDPDLYPGTDMDKRRQNEAKWNRYYECLQEQEKSLGVHGTPIPEAVQGFEGGFIKFDCKFCLNPREEETVDSTEWYYGQVGKSYLSIIFYGDHIMLSPDDKTLHIYNLRVEQSGQYVCILGDSVTVPYYLNVVSGSSEVSQVHAPSSPKGPYPMKPHIIHKHNLALDTEWGEWSKCSDCDKIGRRHKVGYCVVTYQEHTEPPKSDSKRSNFFGKFTNALLNDSYKLFEETEETILVSENLTVLPMHIDLVRIFKFGIPCKSQILPKSIAHLPEVSKRQDEILMGFCKERCRKQEVFIVKDKHGKVVEQANNSAGIYSLLQGIPPVTPEVERVVQYEARGTDVTIVCPGNLNSDAPVKWQADNKLIVPEVLAEESLGRIFVTLNERIQIGKAKVADSKLYTCWQNNELAGTVRLVIEYQLNMSFNHHVMLLGMLLILSVFSYVFLKAYTGRKQAQLGRK